MLGKRDSTEVTLQVSVQLLALHHEAGPAATALQIRRCWLLNTRDRLFGGSMVAFKRFS